MTFVIDIISFISNILLSPSNAQSSSNEDSTKIGIGHCNIGTCGNFIRCYELKGVIIFYLYCLIHYSSRKKRRLNSTSHKDMMDGMGQSPHRGIGLWEFFVIYNYWCFHVNHQSNTQWYSNWHQVCCKDANFSNCYIHYNFMCNKKFPCRLIELVLILLLWQEYDCLLFRLSYYKALWFRIYSQTKNEHHIHVSVSQTYQL